MPDNNSPLVDEILQSLTTRQIADMYERRYDHQTNSSIPRPSKEERDALAQAYAIISTAPPVQNNAGKAQPITDPVVDSNPRPAANNAPPRQEAVAVPMTQAERNAAVTQEYDRRNGRRPLNDPPAPMAPGPYPQQAAVETPMEVEPDQGEPLFAPEPPARQFTPDMPPRVEDPRVRIPGIRSQEVQPGRLQDDYIIGYDPFGQPVRRSIAPHADDYQVPATNKWTGAQSFDQQPDKRQLILMQIMIKAGMLPERAERIAILGDSITQRELKMIKDNEPAQRQRQVDQETARRQKQMRGY